MECRLGCAACCIAISISSPIPGMPDGKPAGVRCIQLTEENLCKLFQHPDRPKICSEFMPRKEICGTDNEFAFRNLSYLEEMTKPDK